MRMKEYVPKCVEMYIKDKPRIISIAFMNAIKILSIAEHLIKNPNCADRYI